MRSVSRSITVVLLLALTVPAMATEQGVLDEVASQLQSAAEMLIELMARLGLPPG